MAWTDFISWLKGSCELTGDYRARWRPDRSLASGFQGTYLFIPNLGCGVLADAPLPVVHRRRDLVGRYRIRPAGDLIHDDQLSCVGRGGSHLVGGRCLEPGMT